MGVNFRTWNNKAPFFGSTEPSDPNWHRRVYSMMVHTNQLPKRSPMLYYGIKPKTFDLASQNLMPKMEDAPLNMENEYESLDIPSRRDEKRNEPTKDGKDGKGDFDSNSYFMLRPLRREPLEMYDTPILSAFLGNY